MQIVLSNTGQIKNELARALIAEFMGTLLFQIFGGAAPPKDTTAPAANGFALVAIVYAFANVSGAHLNPAVTFSLMCTGHTTWWRGLAYIAVQVCVSLWCCVVCVVLIGFRELRCLFASHKHTHTKNTKKQNKKNPKILGSIFGSLIYTGLIPGLHLLTKEFQGGIAPGCFGPAENVTNSELFGWEV